jgi:hypothetical protein
MMIAVGKQTHTSKKKIVREESMGHEIINSRKKDKLDYNVAEIENRR